MNMKRLSCVLLTACILVITVSPAFSIPLHNKTILASTFPIYQLVRHVIQGRDGYTSELMIPSQLGCPHDYALTPQDMKKIATADILVINGLGMEEFLGAPIEKANAHIKIIDSSAGIDGTLNYLDHDEDFHHENEQHEEHTSHEEGNHHHGINPHLFASPRMAARLTLNIASQLAAMDPAGAAIYQKNASTYATRLNKLAKEFSSLQLANNRIVEPHGVFDYLAQDAGLTIVAVMQPHGQEPSAAEMLELVSTIREEKAGAIFTEPQYPEKAGETLSKETGIPVAILDPVASGPENAPLDYYETIMKANLQTLKTTLGSE